MAHALLSPSSAERWMNCPPSVRLGESIPQETSTYAEEGRLAHAFAELYARKRFTQLSRRTFNSQLKSLQAEPQYSKDMERYAEAYTDILAEHAMTFKDTPHTALEVSVPVGMVTGEPGAVGTADCIQLGEGVLWVSDYKYGTGTPVEAAENPQMMLYALGALALYAPVYGDSIQTIRMSILQLRLDSVTDWEIGRDALEAWGRDKVTPRAAQALAGQGEQAAGKWCRFCPVRRTCRARAGEAISVDEAFGRRLPPLLTDTEISDALTRGAGLAAWYEDLKGHALSACLAGKEIPGWKAVEGRGKRFWADQEAAFTALEQNGIEPALLWTREPVTPPALEKAVGKKMFGEVAEGLVSKAPGKPTLVPETDKRPPYVALTVEEAFQNERGNES